MPYRRVRNATLKTVTAAPPIWTATFAGAVLVNFLLSVVFYMLMTTMALYAMGQFGADATEAGLAASIFMLGALVTRLLATRLVVTLGAARTFAIGAALALAFCLAYLVAAPLWVLVAVRFLHGAGFGLAHSAIGGIAQSALPRQRRGEGIGYFATASTLGTALGPLAGIAALHAGGYGGMFVSSATVSLVVLAISLLMRRVGREASAEVVLSDGPAGTGDESASLPAKLGQSAALRTILPIGSIAFVQSLAYSGVAAFIGAHSATLGVPSATGPFFIVYAAAVVLVRLSGGKILDRRGPSTVFYPSIIAYMMGLVLIALAPNLWVLLAGAFLLGLGYGSLLPTGQTIAMSLLPASQSGVAFSWYFLFVDLGFGLGPLLMGFIVQLSDTRTMTLASCGTVLLVGVLFRTLVPRQARL